MKKISLVALSLLCACSVAQAADLMRKPTMSYPQPVPMFTWTGFHIGANIGYGFGDTNSVTTGTPIFNTLPAAGFAPASLKQKRDGVIGGFQAGYDMQFGSVVAGVAADIQFGDINSKSSFTGGVLPAPFPTTALTTSVASKIEYIGTLRGRLGFTPTDRLLIYGTGGLAYGQVKTTGRVDAVAVPTAFWSGTNSEMKVGWVAGAGMEYALTNNISLKGEYLYYDLGSSKVLADGNAVVRSLAVLNGIDYASSTRNRGSIARAGLNLRF
jgi:outer membrane immunogenic protein